jgi:hypothetical protein
LLPLRREDFDGETLAWMIEAQIQLNGKNGELQFTTPTGRMWRCIPAAEGRSPRDY